MSEHRVKSWTHLFQAAWDGKKRHDIRDMRDREYSVGDTLILQEFDMAKGEYTGRELVTRIEYKTDRDTPCALSSNCLERNHVIISFTVLEKKDG